MTDAPPPPPPRKRQGRPAQSVTEWPATSDELAVTAKELETLRSEFLEFKQGLMGTIAFPNGEIPQIKATMRHNHEALNLRLDKQDVELHRMPDTIVAKINGTYVKTGDLNGKVDARISYAQGEGRLAKLSAGTKALGTGALFVMVGIISWIITNVIIPAITHH